MHDDVSGIPAAQGVGVQAPDWEAISEAVRRMRALPAATPPGPELLSRLASAWGNPDFQAGVRFLAEVARRTCTTTSGVLECGSGLSTLVIGLLLEKRPGIAACSLEHDQEWLRFVTDVLKSYDVRSIDVRHGHLEERDGYAWYAPKPAVPEVISLVVCDGPPGSTYGGRYGVVPEMQERFTTDVTILLDDAHREGERETIQKWHDEYGFSLSETIMEDDGIRESVVLSRDDDRG